MTGAVFAEAPAKVNLVLRVGARRADGYHDVDTVFAAVGLCDRLWVERAPRGITVEVAGADLGDPRDNLVHKAARAYLRARGGRGGVAIRLEKRIPVGGGLGGGSSDAAATLRCLDELFAPAMGAAVLTGVARGLGADVSFFLCGSPLALGTGRGDLLTPLPPLPPRPVVLVPSPEGVATAWAYDLLARGREAGGAERRNAARPDRHATAPGRARGAVATVRTSGDPGPLTPDCCPDWTAVARMAHNDFEAPVFEVRPDLRETVTALRRTSPLLALMSGSGSTVFAVHRNHEAAERARGPLERVYGDGRVHLTRTLSSVPAIQPG